MSTDLDCFNYWNFRTGITIYLATLPGLGHFLAAAAALQFLGAEGEVESSTQ